MRIRQLGAASKKEPIVVDASETNGTVGSLTLATQKKQSNHNADLRLWKRILSKFMLSQYCARTAHI